MKDYKRVTRAEIEEDESRLPFRPLTPQDPVPLDLRILVTDDAHHLPIGGTKSGDKAWDAQTLLRDAGAAPADAESHAPATATAATATAPAVDEVPVVYYRRIHRGSRAG